jgi:copper resistance protein C
LLVASLAALVMSTGAAAAHAKLLSMKPADGSTVQRPPVAVVLTYSEVVQNKGAQVAVVAPGGARVDHGAPRILDATVTQPLGPLTEPGTYRVTARVVSADGHPVTDKGSFTVRIPAAPTRPGSPPVRPPGEEASSTGAVLATVGLVAIVVAGLGIALVRHRQAGDLAP